MRRVDPGARFLICNHKWITAPQPDPPPPNMNEVAKDDDYWFEDGNLVLLVCVKFTVLY